MWYDELMDDAAFADFLERAYNAALDEALAQRQQEAELARQVVPVPAGDEPPF